MKKVLIIAIVASLYLIGVYLKNGVDDMSNAAQKLLIDSLPKIADTWEVDTFGQYYSGKNIDDYKRQLKAYRSLGKLVKCPASSDNSLEVSFFRLDEAKVMITCDFENGRAVLQAKVVQTSGGAEYATFELFTSQGS